LRIESGDDERSYASLRSDVMLPGSKELDALIRGEKRTAIFESAPDGVRGCNRIEYLDASDSGELARLSWWRELPCGLGVFESDVHPDVRLGAFCGRRLNGVVPAAQPANPHRIGRVRARPTRAKLVRRVAKNYQ
jgi:hypothetical protein